MKFLNNYFAVNLALSMIGSAWKTLWFVVTHTDDSANTKVTGQTQQNKTCLNFAAMMSSTDIFFGGYWNL